MCEGKAQGHFTTTSTAAARPERSIQMSPRIRFSSYCAVFLALSLSACDNAPETKSRTRVARPVKLITVKAASAMRVNRFPAVIGAGRLSELSLQVGGMLREFPVKKAQSLKRGDLIVRLDQRDFRSTLASARAQYQNAEKEYRRAVRLARQDAIARTVLEQRKTQRDVTKAQLERAEKALADSVLRAPFKGVIAQTMVKKLQNVKPGQVVVKFMSDDAFEATIDLPARYLARIPKNLAKNKRPRAFVILDTLPGQPIKAVFKEASLLADLISQTYAVTFAFHPPENLRVLPGMNATVELRAENKAQTPRVAVPLAAVTNDGKNNYVWAVDTRTMKVSKRVVTLEEGVGETVVVTAGLAANETIAGAGAAYLSEGMKIREWK